MKYILADKVFFLTVYLIESSFLCKDYCLVERKMVFHVFSFTIICHSLKFKQHVGEILKYEHRKKI